MFGSPIEPDFWQEAARSTPRLYNTDKVDKAGPLRNDLGGPNACRHEAAVPMWMKYLHPLCIMDLI